MSMASNSKSSIKYNHFFPSKINFYGKIRDPLHDTIPYTAEEKKIIDSPEFQRLRRIHQTAFIKYVFPGATHTRFEHSLGTMHISGLLYSALISNQRRIVSSLEKLFLNSNAETKNQFLNEEKQMGSLIKTKTGLEFLENSPYLAQCLRFAALLHDCGHSSLSHSGERFMPSWEQLGKNLEILHLPSWLEECLKLKITQSKNTQNSVHHEIYTLLIVQKLFQNHHGKLEDINEELLSEKMGRDICSVLDTSILPHPEGDLAKSGMQMLFHEVISGEIDVDRMDYLLRDSQECGVVYGYFDLGRILDSLGFYLNTATNQYHLALRRSGISAYEDYLRARLSMYHQVYFHKTATACEAMLEYLKKKNPAYAFPLSLKEYNKIDDYSFLSKFQEQPGFTEQNLANDLLLNRKLWKRVYEESILSHKMKEYNSQCHKILNLLKELNIPAELIETSTNLTKLSPKAQDSISKNNFKVIIKNANSFRLLAPIENHSNLINRVDEELIVKRIFIPNTKANGELIDQKMVQRIISELI